MRRNLRKTRSHENNNRLHLIMAIIFLLCGTLILRLFSLQVWQHDLFAALASDQHQVYNQLLPERGKILIQDSPNNDKLYSLAMVKEFALLYAIPQKIVDPAGTAEKLYEIFDQEKVAEEVDKMLDEDEYFKPLLDETITVGDLKELVEFREIKKELEMKLRQEQVVNDYIAKLAKRNDPYEPIKKKVDEDKLRQVMDLKLPGLDYIMERYRFYPEGSVGAHMLGFVGYREDDKVGQYGLEGFFNEELQGKTGLLKAERAADGGVTIVNDRVYKRPQDGSDLALSINRSIQYIACTKLRVSAERHGADGGSVIVMEPATGAILAMCSWPDYDPNQYNEVEDITTFNNPAIFDAYEPGSIFKVFTMAAGIDQNAVTPHTIYTDHGQVMVEGWPKPIKNSDYETHGGHGQVNMVTVLTESLNTGSIFVLEKVGYESFAEYVKNFGFGEKTGIELETEGITNIINLKRNRIRPVEAATASFGQGITATPLQIVSAYAAIVNGGILMKPYLVEEIRDSSGIVQTTEPRALQRVINEKAALLTTGMMVNVVEGGHARRAGVEGYFVGGKTGTAQVADKEKGGYLEDNTIHTFVGFAPAEDPLFVMLVKLDNPKDVYFAANSAAPLFGEIAEFILNYFQVPKER